MRHFHQLDAGDRARLFSRQPDEFSRRADPDTLAVALGATLYMPATRRTLAADLKRQAAAGVMSCVVCLEDAVGEDELPAAEANLVEQLLTLARVADDATDGDVLPLTFVRVRRPDQIASVIDGLGSHAGILSGFVLPKFTNRTGERYLDALTAARAGTGLSLLAMPVIESPDVIHLETRRETLLGVQQLLAKHCQMVLAVRLGATDLSAAYALRRDRDLTIYDVGVVADVITDVVNILGRADGSGHVITGPVWEYFAHHDRLFKPQLRSSPFEEQDAKTLRHQLITRDLDGLIREIVLDKANGLTGKTVIHPTHVAAVHALSVVTHEEYSDARDVLGEEMAGGGVRASAYKNKMNEAKPHRAWAERILRRAGAFGVAAEDVSFVDLLIAGLALPLPDD